MGAEAHFFCGGIRTDAFGATALPGLYAIGESAGGCHGSNRLANDAFTECEDFPERNDADWLCNVLVRQRADGILEPRKTLVVTV